MTRPLAKLPSPLWGRGWTAAGALFSRGGTGEGVHAGLDAPAGETPAPRFSKHSQEWLCHTNANPCFPAPSNLPTASRNFRGLLDVQIGGAGETPAPLRIIVFGGRK
ncbi:hypothetical protein SBA2_30121 [Acidobacteriia bacterium SbA2]|nr:hypothetical protein SBA2_30121 [Acidobacteriia bacterium SbA2]